MVVCVDVLTQVLRVPLLNVQVALVISPLDTLALTVPKYSGSCFVSMDDLLWVGWGIVLCGVIN
jgi:hypothetical protein